MLKILFIGNSQMGVCNLPNMVQVLSESASTDQNRIESESVVMGGATLKKHWEAGVTEETPRGRITKEHWNAVVIQEIYNATREEFEPYAERFCKLIKTSGSRMVLFATASITEYYSPGYSYPESFRKLNDMQIEFGKKHNIPVAAAGYAWERYLGSDPTEENLLDLYHQDRGHPGWKGSYIYACLLYAVLTGKNPEGLTHEPDGMKKGLISKNEATQMQRAAWEVYSELFQTQIP